MMLSYNISRLCLFFSLFIIVSWGFFLPTSRILGSTLFSEPKKNTKRSYGIKSEIVGKYQTVPVSLFRMAKKKHILRERHEQLKKGSHLFDFTMSDAGLYEPAPDTVFIGPNGLSFRPLGLNLYDNIGRSTGKNQVIAEVPQGFVLPPELIFLHEHGDHWSLQTTKPILREDFESLVNELLLRLPSHTKDDFYKLYPI